MKKGDDCPTCGTAMAPSRGPLSLPINGEKVSVEGIKHLRCPKCGEKLLDMEAARRLQQDAIAAYRAKYGLLSANEIRAIRQHFGLTQAEMAKVLHLGANTLSRWEAGRNVQTEALDWLLRLMRDVPEAIEYMRSHAA